MGLLSWLAAGWMVAAVGLLLGSAAWRRRRWKAVLALASVGALVGGLLATAFDFGGLLALDPRSGVSAVLGAVAGILLVPLLLRP